MGIPLARQKAGRGILVTDMKFLKIVKRRSFLSEVVYIALNVGLAVALVLIIRITGSLLPAFLLILLSMWRVFAVRPRFWFAHIQANLVSFIISVSFAVFIYSANPVDIGDFQSLVVQSILAVLYIGWLVFLKPQSQRKYIVAQAGVALFVGTTAVYIMAHGWLVLLVVLLMWLIGYATARHILSHYEETHLLLLSLVWGLVVAEIGWLAYHWTIAYRLPIATNILLPQVSIIVLSLGFLAYKAYNSYFHHQKIRIVDIILPLLFTVGIIGVLMLAFNSPSSGI